MPFLSGINIKFHTHDDDKNTTTVLHVFVKNRLNTSLSPDSHGDFISNFLDYQRYLDGGDLRDSGTNPYLGVRVGLAADQVFPDPSDRDFDLDLPPMPVSLDDIVLPAVSIHILPDDRDRWIFDYTLTFRFDDGQFFEFSSKDAGIPGVILDQDNRDYYGICAENPLLPLPVPERPDSTATLSKITIEFVTHNDDKNDDSTIDVRIGNRLSGGAVRPLAVGLNLFDGVTFDDPGFNSFIWSAADGTLVGSDPHLMADMVLPVVDVILNAGQDRWIFDYRVIFEFTDPANVGQKGFTFVSRTGGVILDQDNVRHVGVYQGPPFPTVTPPTAPALTPVSGELPERRIPLEVLRRKFDEFVNNRNDADDSHTPPLRKIRVHNAGKFNDDTLPETYFDVRAITAAHEGVTYVSNPTSVGQISQFIADLGDVYFVDINSDHLSVGIDPASPTPFSVTVDFETNPPDEIISGVGHADIDNFSITLRLTLGQATTTNRFGAQESVVDLLSWVPELQNMKVLQDPASGQFHYVGTFLGQPVDLFTTDSLNKKFLEQVVQVHLQTTSTFDPGGKIRQGIRDQIFDQLKKEDRFTGRTARDGINSLATSWLLGGVGDDDRNTDDNNLVIHDIKIEGDAIVAHYTGPRNAFVPQTPANWPAGHDFSQGTLANIDHIVVLTMENRSFDHMLGYLSLPAALGGAGRTDVDGLKGGESNAFGGTTYPITPLADTFFHPDPPHGYEPVHRAINGGKMDGFVRSWVEQHGRADAGKIMGYHTAANVPTYDGLARDFAIGHRWFASHPGPTFPNRYYELTGRPNLDAKGFWEFDDVTPSPAFTRTIFDELSDRDVSWAYYEQGYTFLRLFAAHTFDADHIIDLRDQDRGFFAAALAGTLPSVSFIDPHFIELPPDANADGPPADIKDGQAFVREVVEAVVAGPAWDSTLLVIVYDEHGGFYDHVPPPPAVRVSPDLPIDTLGLRVPAFAVSPWVAAGSVFGRDDLVFDHTSLLKTIARRFMSGTPPFLGARYAAASDLSAVLGTVKRSSRFRPFLRYNFDYNPSQLRLGVKDADPAAGAALWQLAADGTAAEDFSFEDAGGGSFYIRSRLSNLYLTADTPAAGGIPTTAPVPVVLRPKFVPGTTPAAADVGLPGIQAQKWLIGISAGPDLYTIQNAAVPNKMLQPADPIHPSPVVLGSHTFPPGGPDQLHVWKVTSPLLHH